MTDLSLEIIGFRGAAPADGACSAYLVRSATTAVLLDCGPGAAGVLQRRGRLGTLDAIVVSHAHADHNLDLVPLAIGRAIGLWDGDRVPLHVPAGGGEEQVRRLEATLGDIALADVFDERPYATGDTLTVGDLTITFAPTTHSIPCNAIRVTDGERTLVYGADGEPSDPLAALADGADLLLLEATGPYPGHSTADQSRALAAQVGARVVLTHLFDPLTGDDLAYEGLTVAV